MKYFILVFLSFFSGGVLGQNLVEKYYANINKAELAICNHQYQAAAKYYKKAFKTDISFGIDIVHAFQVSYRFNDKKNDILHYAHRLAQRNYNPYTIFSSDSMVNEKLSLQLKRIQDTTKRSVIDMLADTLDCIQQADQADRKSGCAYQDTCKPKVNIRDSLRWESIEKLYQQYGNLNESIAGKLFHSHLHLILLHNTEWLRFPSEFLLEQVKLGNFDARIYAFLYDIYFANISRETQNKEISKYYTDFNSHECIDNTLFIHVPIDKTNIDKNRKEIFLETMDEYLRKVIYQFTTPSHERYFHFYTLNTFYFKDSKTEAKKRRELYDQYKDSTDDWDFRYFVNDDFYTR